MSMYRTSRQGEELVKNALAEAQWASSNGYDIDWQGIKINVKARGIAGKMGNSAFTFSRFGNKDCIYVLVAIGEDDIQYFWVLSAKELENKSSFYASIEKAVRVEEVPDIIKSKHSEYAV